jgi:hypothetical protein
MTDFDLRALVREVCDHSTVADPLMLAKEVNRRIKQADRDAALESALPLVVQNELGRLRMRHHAPIPGTPQPSRKVAGIREMWRRTLRDRINVGPDVSDWKFLADCTAEDLDYAAALREEHARRNAARAAQYRRLAELLNGHGVSTVGELPESALKDGLGDDE